MPEVAGLCGGGRDALGREREGGRSAVSTPREASPAEGVKVCVCVCVCVCVHVWCNTFSGLSSWSPEEGGGGGYFPSSWGSQSLVNWS